jgi:signal transduction histidine kinase
MRVRAEDELRWTAWSRAPLIAALVLLVAFIGLLDYWTGTEITFSIFFLIPIALGAWFVGPRTSISLAVLSAAAWLLADLYGGFPYSSRTIPFWNGAVGLSFFLIIAATLSARKRAERRILELMNIKSEFVSHVSHEIRTPLTCIQEGIEIVMDQTSGPLNPVQHAHLQTAKRNIDRLARLLNDVLSYQKLDARRMELSLEPCDLDRLVAQAVEEFTLPARKKGLELVWERAARLPPVSCDADRISQVLCNLLSNALKFSDHGRILVRTESTPGAVHVAIEDQGVGIPEGGFERIFQGFVQLSTPPGARREGTGLGLSIARRIIELHGGRLGGESRPGRGSIFRFTLPVPAEDRAA